MIPEPLMAEFRAEAQRRSERPVIRMAAAVTISLWMAVAASALPFRAGTVPFRLIATHWPNVFNSLKCLRLV